MSGITLCAKSYCPSMENCYRHPTSGAPVKSRLQS